MENDSNKFLLNAAQKLNQANKELYKPKEDIVSFLVCKNSQFAIENYLKGYLLKNDVDPSEFKTITSLYEQCKLINKEFEKVNLTEFDCKSVDTELRFCNDVSKVSNCYSIADSLDTLLRQQKII
ncbi:HEPN domain-containing protein [Mariniflexile aquimaris]|uniref:HEPN domain-containing protein n=1 Tax=Mariniflexile aquimaris TaxID=881009 RepID=A0ABW3BP12_9FLAO